MPDASVPLTPSNEGVQIPLANYFNHLSELEKQDIPTLDQLVAVMVARSEVQQWLTPERSAEALAMVVQLDHRLKAQGPKLDLLTDCRETLNPPESQWWWWLDTVNTPNSDLLPEEVTENEAENRPRWSRWDWLWNLGTVTCLVVSTGLMSQTAKAFSEEGFDLLGTVSTIGQGAGLALVARGVLTDQGKKKVKKFLHSLNIPDQYHAEATFAGSAALLTMSIGLYANLPSVGNLYYSWGQRQETHENWDKALENYGRAARFNPQNSDIVLAAGH